MWVLMSSGVGVQVEAGTILVRYDVCYQRSCVDMTQRVPSYRH